MYYIIDVTLFTLTVMSICKIFVVKFDNRLVFDFFLYIFFFINNFLARRMGKRDSK